MNLLFIYGTLLMADNEYGLYLRQNSRFLSDGMIPGHLYNVGSYPAAVIDLQSENSIKGQVVLLGNATEAFELLDEYEGFGELEEQPNEFVREVVEVSCSYETLKCWAYVFKHPTQELEVIPSGDYVAFLNAKNP